MNLYEAAREKYRLAGVDTEAVHGKDDEDSRISSLLAGR